MKRFAAILSLFAFCLPALGQTTAPTTTTTSATTTTATAPAPAKKAHVAFLKLTDELRERPESFNFSVFNANSPAKSPALSSLIVTLSKAAKDDTLAGLVFDVSSFSLSLNQAHELGQQLLTLRKAHKTVAIYASDFTTATYLLASHADRVIMPENGNLLMPGVSLNMLFFKGTLEKLGMDADFIQVGKYKGAEEPFMRKTASPEYRAQIEGLVDGLYGQIVKTIDENRPNMDEDTVKKAIDEGWLTGKRAKDLGLVDWTLTRDKLEAWIDTQFPGGALLVEDYGQPKKKNIDLDSPFGFLSMLSTPKTTSRTREPAVAVIYATGQIMPDYPGAEGNTNVVTPATIRTAVDKALKDNLVKAIVLRIDSPGGSASASDEIWTVLKDADKKKPITVSMGRLAASGGYYIACAGRSITANPNTITGSIGVVGGKIIFKGLLDKAGINVETVSRGKHAEMLSMLRPFSDDERTYLTAQMEEVYATFTSRVMEARAGKVLKIDDVAQGRLYTGVAGKKAGLVDTVGTLQDTIAAAAKTAGIEKNYQILVLPEAKTFADILREGLTMDASMPLETQAALKAMPAEYRAEALRVLNLVNVLQKERVLMSLPVGIVEENK